MSQETYNSIYSSKNEIKSRLGLDDSAGSLLEIYQKNTDDTINHSIRKHIGSHDANGYDITLPLQGDANVVNSTGVTLSIDGAIQKIANDYVIALYRKDTAEDNARIKESQKDLQKYLDDRFGYVNDVALDFTKISPGV